MTHLKSTASLKVKSEALLEDLRNLKVSSEIRFKTSND